MVSHIDRVANGLQKLKSMPEGPHTLGDREKTIRQLKIDLTFFQNIPPCFEPSPKECILAREVYEYATFLSVEKQDILEYEHHMSILKTYYDEFKQELRFIAIYSGVIPPSQKMYAILGLYLLYLLSYNKISEYHTEIELIPIEEQQNVYITVPVSLEQHFVEGSYNKILTQKQNVPLEAYHFFINKFVDAIRFEIARSAERAYESLSLRDTQKIFMIDNQQDLLSFINGNSGKEGVEWQISGDRLFFSRQKEQMKEIPANKMISLSLDYATELNRIV
ncbi:UNKNOWN [Stylonychia lemnae]|uniref:CSN8/PSMD8/EIF3K domain-containing protein n=1 Tax=Stylonychia lemnae TaxID=5949 RepID=A0A078AUS8_STYLE|nr:UNKNOWN [Stylonychia lemnae]|eukprot:CDW84633.1 UNKNOWN [Stylonychia lemnae]